MIQFHFLLPTDQNQDGGRRVLYIWYNVCLQNGNDDLSRRKCFDFSIFQNKVGYFYLLLIRSLVGTVIGFGLNSQNFKFDVDIVSTDRKPKITSRLRLVSTANPRFQIWKRSTMRITLSLQSQHGNFFLDFFADF